MGWWGEGQGGVGTEQGSHAKKQGWVFLSINDLTQLLAGISSWYSELIYRYF